jgi:recombination protein RecA
VSLVKRNKETQSIIDNAQQSEIEADLSIINRKISTERVVSTGSTLLDLAISGKVRVGGGVPGGIIVEIYGPSGSGKTAILAELCASAQNLGGEALFVDPEARLNQEYAKIYGISLEESQFDYKQPDTVTELFNEIIFTWKPKNDKVINIIASDSLAALSTKLEMEDEDKMGMRRAKEFSQGLRKTCRIIMNNHWLVACTNQIRQGDGGETTPGGEAVKFYSSLRIRIGPSFKGSKIIKKTKVDGYAKEVEKVVGIVSNCKITKSSVDDPFREVSIYILFGYGIDDIRGNLQYVKDMTGASMYDCFTKEWKSMDNAIKYIEEGGLEQKLKERVYEIWDKVESSFVIQRKRKER